jgi:hypothetical protein
MVLPWIKHIHCQSIEDSGGGPQIEPDRMGGGSTGTQEAGRLH